MRVKFWGVRGSLTTPEPEYSVFGGNTPCIEVVLSNGTSLALDAGMGLRWYNLDRMGRPENSTEYHILLTNFHWDHIQGLPFSPMVYISGNQVHLYGASSCGRNMREYLLNQQRLDFCPVPNFLLDGVGANLSLHEFDTPSLFTVGTATIRWDWVPRGSESPVVGYRIEEGGKVLTYLTNVEYLGPPGQCTSAVDLARSADLLLHDGQQLPGEPLHPGYSGHSSYLEAVALAEAAQCRQLVLCHHDPRRTDTQLASLEEALRGATRLPTCMAREAAVFEL